MGGTSTLSCTPSPLTCTDPVGVYGMLGKPAAGNVPGSRGYQATWTDKNGNLWLFGGVGFASTVLVNDDQLNDLWEYNPTANEWAWMGGNSNPPYDGDLGNYGTLGVPSAQNIPSGRSGAVAWTDASGKFWLFGGLGAMGGNLVADLNDLWEFDPSTLEWTWVSGSSTPISSGQAGVCGTLGTPSAQNVPGTRDSAVGWTDGNGDLWLFGGNGSDCTNLKGSLNDLWRFDTSSKEWAWMGGSSTVGAKGVQPGVYGTLGLPAAGNIPGGRRWAVSWTDKNGNFWLFGGYGADSAGNFGDLNDLWEFNPSSGQWAWISGSSTVPTGSQNGGQPGVYGTIGSAAASNVPGGRFYAVTAIAANGNLRLFGGEGSDSAGVVGFLNDLWEFNISTHEWTWLGGASTLPKSTNTPNWLGNPGVYGTQGVPAIGNVPGGRGWLTGWTDTYDNLWLFGGFGFDSAGNGGQLNDLWEYELLAATPIFSVTPGTFTSAQTVTISDATPGASIYYTADGKTAPTSSSTPYKGAITVSATETIQAVAVASGYADSTVASAAYVINLPSTFTLAASPSSLTIKSAQQGTVTLTVTPQNGFNSAVSFACSGLAEGASCTFNPSTITPGGTATSTTLTINAESLSSALRREPESPFTAISLGLVVCVFGWKWRRVSRYAPLLALTASLGLLSGCGGGGGGVGGGGSSPVTSTVTITATSGTLQQTATLTLTVD